MWLDQISYVRQYCQNMYTYAKCTLTPSVSIPAGALNDFDKTNVPPPAPEAQAASDTGAKTEEKVINSVLCLSCFTHTKLPG